MTNFFIFTALILIAISVWQITKIFELSQTKNTIMSESDIDSKRSNYNKLSQRRLSDTKRTKKRSSSILKKSTEEIPEITVPKSTLESRKKETLKVWNLLNNHHFEIVWSPLYLKDNNINYKTVEYMCSTKGGHVLSHHLKTFFII